MTTERTMDKVMYCLNVVNILLSFLTIRVANSSFGLRAAADLSAGSVRTGAGAFIAPDTVIIRSPRRPGN